MPEITRRALGGVTLLGVATPLVAACGSDETTPTSGEESSQAPSPEGTADGGGDDEGGESLVAASEVPVGGGVVLSDAKVVVTQPAEGTFKAFTAVCTHQGCIVRSVSDGEIGCNCHGSVFSAEDGSVVNGPAQEPLDEITVTVTDGQVTRA